MIILYDAIGFIAGMNHEHQVIQHTQFLGNAMRFRNMEQVKSWIDAHADVGFGLSRASVHAIEEEEIKNKEDHAYLFDEVSSQPFIEADEVTEDPDQDDEPTLEQLGEWVEAAIRDDLPDELEGCLQRMGAATVILAISEACRRMAYEVPDTKEEQRKANKIAEFKRWMSIASDLERVVINNNLGKESDA